MPGSEPFTNMEPIEQDRKDGFFRRHAVLIGVGAIALSGVIVAVFQLAMREKSAPRPSPEVSVVRIAVPPPPPPPPPRQEPQPQAEDIPPNPREMIVQERIAANEEKPAASPEASTEAPAEAMGTNIQGDGPNAFGLTGRGGGGVIGGTGGGTGAGGQGGSRWGWYGGQVQTQIHDALLAHQKTRSAGVSTTLRVWVDAAGRVTQVEVVRSTGDAAIDKALQNEVFAGLTLREAPPADMPQPIVLRVSGRRAN